MWQPDVCPHVQLISACLLYHSALPACPPLFSSPMLACVQGSRDGFLVTLRYSYRHGHGAGRGAVATMSRNPSVRVLCSTRTVAQGHSAEAFRDRPQTNNPVSGFHSVRPSRQGWRVRFVASEGYHQWRLPNIACKSCRVPISAGHNVELRSRYWLACAAMARLYRQQHCAWSCALSAACPPPPQPRLRSLRLSSLSWIPRNIGLLKRM